MVRFSVVELPFVFLMTSFFSAHVRFPSKIGLVGDRFLVKFRDGSSVALKTPGPVA